MSTENKKDASNVFLVKYKSEVNRIKFSSYVLKLVKKHEILDFRVEEKYAFEEERIIYNGHTLASGDFTFEKLEYQFLKYYSY